MLRSTFGQLTFDRITKASIGLEDDSFESVLREHLLELVRVEDFARLYSTTDGADSCCPVRLFAVVLLQTRYGLSDRDAIRRCRRNLAWRYALQLGPTNSPPSRTSLQRFRAGVVKTLGEDFIHKRVLRLARQRGQLEATSLQAVDSTNVDCRGAVLDTYNLIARAIGLVMQRVAHWLVASIDAVAMSFGAEQYLARSIKSVVTIDWSCSDERDGLVTALVGDADRVVAAMRDTSIVNLKPPKPVIEAVALLETVAHQDVEERDDGTTTIRKGVTPGRIISVTDPTARFGRKSSSKVIRGHKVHVLATTDGELVTAITITDASTHDAVPTVSLLEQAEALDIKPDRILADLAYGTGQNRRDCAEHGVTVLTKTGRSGTKTIPKSAFDIDLDGKQVTCPAGQTTTTSSLMKAGAGSDDRVRSFRFGKATCIACPLAHQCNSETQKGRGRTVKLSRFEAELQQAKAFNQLPEAKQLLRKRCGIERIISHLTRMGLRSARYFGEKMTQFQAFTTAAVYNLQRCARLEAKQQT